MEKEEIIGFISCWKLNNSGRCRLPINHEGECLGVPYKGDKKSGEHRWKLSWPGNYCLDCGMEDPNEQEDALINCSCSDGCENCLYTGWIPNPELKIEPCPCFDGNVNFVKK